MALILGIGVGLFVLIVLWAVSILVCVISSKLKVPLSYAGPGCISLSVLLTATLFALPRRTRTDLSPTISGPTDGQTEAMLDYDWTAYVVLPTYLTVGLLTFGLSTGLVANFYLFPDRTQISTINSRRIHFAN